MLILIRHGETDSNVAGLLVGRSDVGLTAQGRLQVNALRSRLGRPLRLISSPLRRAIDTANGLDLGLAVEVDERWIEVDYGEHEGRQLSAVPPDLWRRWRADPHFRPADGESIADVGLRVRSACDELFNEDKRGARNPDGDVVVVSHVSPIKAAMAWALGIGDEAAWRMHLSNASVTTIGWSSGTPVVHGFNWVPGEDS